jgi:hypothetical protein
VEYLPNMIRVILYVKSLGHDFGYAATGPKVGSVTGFYRPCQENLQQLLLLPRVQTGLAARMWFGN